MTQTFDTIDTNIFKINELEEKCNGYNDCSSVKRIMTALTYYNNKISSQKPQDFIDFCDKYKNVDYQKYLHINVVFHCCHLF